MDNELVQQVLREDPVLAAKFKDRDEELHREEKMRARTTDVNACERVLLSKPLRASQLDDLGLEFIGIEATEHHFVYERIGNDDDDDERVVALSDALDPSQLQPLGLMFASHLRDEHIYQKTKERNTELAVTAGSHLSKADRRALANQLAENVDLIEQIVKKVTPELKDEIKTELKTELKKQMEMAHIDERVVPPLAEGEQGDEHAYEQLSAFNPRLNSNGRVVFDTNLSLDRLPSHMRGPHTQTVIRTMSTSGERSKKYKVVVPPKGCAKLQMNKSVAETFLADNFNDPLMLEIVCDDGPYVRSISEEAHPVRAKIPPPKKSGHAETKSAATTKPHEKRGHAETKSATTKQAQFSSARKTLGNDQRGDQIMMAILSKPWDEVKKTDRTTIHYWFEVMDIELEDDACVEDFTRQGLLARLKKFYDDKLANGTVQAELQTFRAEQEKKKLKK